MLCKKHEYEARLEKPVFKRCIIHNNPREASPMNYSEATICETCSENTLICEICQESEEIEE